MLPEGGVRMIEETEAVFQTQDTGCCVIDTLHADTSFLHEFAEYSAVVGLVGFHRHVYAGIYGYADGVFLVAGHFLTGI